MAKYRELGRKTDVRLAFLRSQAAALIADSKIVTVEARAKEVRKMVEPLITLAVKEKDSFETVSVMAKMPRKDASGKRIREEKGGKRVVVYDAVRKEIKRDKSPRANARHHIPAELYAVGEFDPKHREAGKKVDPVVKLFDEYGPRCESRGGDCTYIVKIGLRKDDVVMEALLELA